MCIRRVSDAWRANCLRRLVCFNIKAFPPPPSIHLDVLVVICLQPLQTAVSEFVKKNVQCLSSGVTHYFTQGRRVNGRVERWAFLRCSRPPSFNDLTLKRCWKENLTTRGKVQRVSKERGAIATQSILVVIDAAAYIVFIDSRCSFFFHSDIPIGHAIFCNCTTVQCCV